jgi:hypothetical protein
MWVAAVALVALGAALRIWILWHTPLNSDQATLGEMGRQILRGHFYTFYWGQQYGGVEPYAIAFMMAIFGAGTAAVNSAASVLTALLCIAVWRLGRRIFPGSLIGASAGLLLWVWPEATLWLSTREYGFRNATMLCGVLTLMAVHEVVFGRRRRRDWVLLGAALGVGLWSSPEISYYAVPAAVVVAVTLLRDRSLRAAFFPRGLVAAAGAFVAGSLPWWYTNLNTGFASLNVDSRPSSYGPSTYGERLHVFFVKVLPLLTGLRLEGAGRWIVTGGPVLYGILLAVSAVSLALLVVRWPPSRPAVLVVLLYPFVYSLFAVSIFWNDARYGSLLSPVLSLVLVAGFVFSARALATAVRRPVGSRTARTPMPPVRALVVGAAVVLIGLAVSSTLYSFRSLYRQPLLPPSWIGSMFQGDSEAPTQQTIALLEGAGIRYGYAQYWIAYDLDFLSDDRLVISAPNQVRWRGNYDRIVRAGHPSWLFVNPAAKQLASNQFGTASFGMSAARSRPS